MELWRLAVLDDGNIEYPGVFHRAAHDVRVPYRQSVVGDRDRSRSDHLTYLRQLLARHALGRGPDRVDTCLGRLSRLAKDELGDGGAVIGRVGIRHAGDGRESARDRGCRP